MGRQEVCIELLKRGIDVNHQDTSDLNHSALTLAAEAGHAEVVIFSFLYTGLFSGGA